MKILFYNWVQFDNKEKAGGGVSVYIKNLIEYFTNNTDYEVYFLGSGNKYNPLVDHPYIAKSKNVFGKKCNTYEVINSDVFGPLGNLCWDLDRYLNDTSTTDVMEQFIRQHGPFDIIHIQNIGGFGQNFLKMKEKFPNTKFVFDLHNYNCFCMNSYLFNHEKQEMCLDNHNGQDCLTCYLHKEPSDKLYKNRVKLYWSEHLLDKLIYKFSHGFKNLYKNDYKKYYVTKYKNCKCNAESYVKFRENNVKYINENFDLILAVSKKVKEVAVNYGLDANKIKVSYIGTKFAEVAKPPKEYDSNKKFKIAYLGYANVLKGFFFLINALSSIPEDIAKNIDLVFAAKGAKEKYVKNKLSHFNSVEIINGYTHDNIQDILEDVTLGVVPVLWDDNLPQVAIEMVSNGIPILCSDFGGASELSSSELFKFKGGDVEDFKIKLTHLIQNPQSLSEYWKGHNGLMTMDKHVQILTAMYKEILDNENESGENK